MKTRSKANLNIKMSENLTVSIYSNDEIQEQNIEVPFFNKLRAGSMINVAGFCNESKKFLLQQPEYTSSNITLIGSKNITINSNYRTHIKLLGSSDIKINYGGEKVFYSRIKMAKESDFDIQSINGMDISVKYMHENGYSKYKLTTSSPMVDSYFFKYFFESFHNLSTILKEENYTELLNGSEHDLRIFHNSGNNLLKNNFAESNPEISSEINRAIKYVKDHFFELSAICTGENVGDLDILPQDILGEISEYITFESLAIENS